tara:strand:- start:45 stop:521 length:477 start_codon:yes stop_codon:yes gene_type:complete
MNGLTLKRGVITYAEKMENEFAIKLYDSIKKECTVEPMSKKYDYVDFKIIDRNNPNNFLYIELKSRNVKYQNYKSFIISHKKMINIKKSKLLPTILVWGFDNKFFFTEYTDKFIDYKTRTIQNSLVIDIPSLNCSTGLDNLRSTILNMLIGDQESKDS